jgi:hypothetical protein
MPFLFLILGDKLGLNVTASTAPLHVFVKYTDSQSGETYNLETTDDGNPVRLSSYRHQLFMTDKALTNGVYMKKLSKKETVAVMATLLLDHFLEQKDWVKVLSITDVILKYYPQHTYAMLKKANAFSGVMQQQGLWKYRSSKEVPADKRKLFDYLVYNTNILWQQAEHLGWKPQPKEYDKQYLELLKEKK